MNDYLTLDEFAEAVGDSRRNAYQRLQRWDIPTKKRKVSRPKPEIIVHKDRIQQYLDKRQAKEDRMRAGGNINKVPHIYHSIEDRRIDKHEWFVITLADRLLRCSWDQFREVI